jgi:protein subunit release factor B
VKFSVTSKDLVRETFRCGGKGGQNVNKRDTGVRFRHPPSGAVAESREHRTQGQNEREAFRRLAESPRFRAWAGLTLQAMEEGHRSVEAKVDAMMDEKNLRMEVGVDTCSPGEVHCDVRSKERL